MIISVDGNIGSGKSTVLDVLSKRGFRVYKEGIDNWSDVLEKFYEDQARWAFTLQITILHDMYSKYIESLKYTDEFIFFERNPVSSLLFLNNSFECDNLSEIEHKHYMQLHETLSWKPDKIYKLNVPSRTCYDRILLRNDPSIEKGLTFEYVKLLEKKYELLPGEYIDGTCSVDEIADEIVRKNQSL